MVTEQESRDMVTAIDLFQASDAVATQAQYDSNIAIAQTWFNGLGFIIPTDRTQALNNYNQILGLLRTETDAFRLVVLRQELKKAEDKFKEIKANG